jgi:hypothetical protein
VERGAPPLALQKVSDLRGAARRRALDRALLLGDV